MKRIFVALLLGAALLLFVPSSFAVCTPDSSRSPGPVITSAQYIANGGPDGTSNCWSAANVTMGTTVCEVFPQWTANDFDFSYGGEIDQTINIPTTDTFNYYTFNYFLDFQNLNQTSAWDLQLTITIFDQTTHQYLMTDHYDASQPNLLCGRREIPGIYANLAGHTILVRIMGNRVVTSDELRVFGIQFWGYQN